MPTGAAVNVTGFPEHPELVPLVTEILTDEVTELLTVMIILPDVTLAELAHAALEIILHVITSELASPVVE